MAPEKSERGEDLLEMFSLGKKVSMHLFQSFRKRKEG